MGYDPLWRQVWLSLRKGGPSVENRIHSPAQRAARRLAFALVLWLLVGAASPVASGQSPPASSLADPAPGAARPLPPAAGEAPLSGAATGYHLNMRGGFQHVARFTVPNAQNATIIGPQVDFIFGMDYDGQRIWGLNQTSGQVGIISETTGAFSATASITGRGASENLTGLTIAPDGSFFVSTSDGTTNRLYTLKPDTGVLTLIGPIANATLVIALAMNCAGELYGHDIGADMLVRIPPANPAGTTVIGPTGQNASFAQGMDFDDTTGTLYAWLYRSGGAGDFVTFNTATGAATAVTPLTGEFEGLIKTTCGPVVTITSPPPAAGQYGQPYAHTFTASTAPSLFTLSGALPPGLDFDPTGLITGTPTLAGVYPNLVASVDGSPQATQPFTLTIAKAPLTARAADATRRVGQDNPPFAITYAGFVGADTAAALAVPPVAQSAATPASPVGAYPITVAGGSDENYEFAYQPGTLTVTRGAWFLPSVFGAPPAPGR